MRPTAAAVKRRLRELGNPEKAAFFPKFFKTGEGEYGEGDEFIGVVVPDQRKIAQEYQELPLGEIAKLLADRIHECRLTGTFVLVLQFASAGEQRQRELVDFYLDHLDGINNWDIVDASAHKILGVWLVDHPRGVLNKLAESGELWRQRVAVIACLTLIKNGEFSEITRLSRRFLKHPHDLIHKACGWMLREMGKRNASALDEFLDQHASQMPRTMLRYSIERLPKAKRNRYLTKKA